MTNSIMIKLQREVRLQFPDLESVHTLSTMEPEAISVFPSIRFQSHDTNNHKKDKLPWLI